MIFFLFIWLTTNFVCGELAIAIQFEKHIQIKFGFQGLILFLSL